MTRQPTEEDMMPFYVVLGEMWTIVPTSNQEQRHRVIRSSAERKPLPPWLRWWVLARDDYRCKHCGATGLPFEIDHVVPWSAGGEDISTNLRTLCIGCNQARSNYRYWERPRILPIALCCDRCLPEEDCGDGSSAAHVWCAGCRQWSSVSNDFEPVSASYPDGDTLYDWAIAKLHKVTDRKSHGLWMGFLSRVEPYRSAARQKWGEPQ